MLISKFDTENIEKKLEDFKSNLQICLPDEYKNFLVKYNGGKTPKTEFKMHKISSDISGFYGIGEVDKDYRFDDLIRNKNMDEFLGDEMLPIAINVWGDYITIGISGKNYGKIFFLYHDRKKKYILLSEDFGNFVEKCKSKKIGHVRTIDERKQSMIENGYGDEITEESLKGWQAEIDEYAGIHQEEVILGS